MRRRALLLVACLLAFGLTAGSVGGTVSLQEPVRFVNPPGEEPTPVAPPGIETTERLVFPATEDRIAEGQLGVDPTVATSTSFSRLESRYHTLGMEAEMAAANGSEEELDIVRSRLDRVERQISEDLEREREAYEALASNERTPSAFLREVTVLHMRSTVITSELEALVDALREVTAPVTNDRPQRLRGEVSQAQLEVQTLQGPVTERSAAVMRADEPTMDPITIRATESGYVLATVQDGLFLRESLASDNRVRGSGAGFANIDDARDITAGQYPWTVDEAVESEDVPRGEIFSSTVDHPHGTTGIYVDAETERPFRDEHELDLFSLPTVTAAENATDELAVRVERTFVGGPTQVSVTEGGEPVADAEIRVDGRAVGATEGSGAHWFVATEEAFEVSVQSSGSNVTAGVEIPG